MAETETAAATTGKTRGRRRVREGVVTSDRGHKTITVVAAYQRKHWKYGKFMRRRTKLHAHDENNEAVVGDLVQVMECRPISKTKFWRLVKVLVRR